MALTYELMTLEEIPADIRENALRVWISRERVWTHITICYDEDMNDFFLSPFIYRREHHGHKTVAVIQDGQLTTSF